MRPSKSEVSDDAATARSSFIALRNRVVKRNMGQSFLVIGLAFEHRDKPAEK